MKERGEVPEKLETKPIVDPIRLERAQKTKRFIKRIGLGVLIFVVLIIGSGTVYATLIPAGKALRTKLTNRYINQASLVLVITDGKDALEGATVTLSQTDRTTVSLSDKTGNVAYGEDIVFGGDYTLTVEKSGYELATKSGTIIRGMENNLGSIALIKRTAPTYTLVGYLVDWVNGQPIQDAQVTIGAKTLRTNPAGEYKVENLDAGAYSIVVSRAGYQGQTLTRTITDQSITDAKIELIPTAQLIFVSNRENGKRNLYVTGYDGNNQRPFVGSLAKGERFAPSISPDGRTVAYVSTEDELKDTSGYALSRLYLSAADGSNPRKLSDDVSYSFEPVWSPNGQYLFASGYTTTDRTIISNHIFSVLKNTSQDVGEAAGKGVFSNDSQWFAYTALASDGSSGYAIKLLNVLSGERRTLTTLTSYPNSLVMSSSGSSLTYEVYELNSRRQFQIAFTGGQPTEVPLADMNLRTLIPAPGGTANLFVETRDGKRDLFLIDAQGAEKRLTELGVVSDTSLPRWSDSGSYVTFTVRKEGETAMYVVARSGGAPRKITDVTDL